MNKISKIKLDDTKHIFVIAEAGSNWKKGSYQEDVKRAKELINVAVLAGADAIKFQTYNPKTVYVPNAGKSKYLIKSGIDKNVFEIFQEYSMSYKMLKELAKICKKKKIIFMSTPFSVEDAKEVNKYTKIHKVAAFEINHIRLLEYLATTKKPIILSTGASNFSDIDFAIKLLKKKGVKRICLLQTTSKYPAPINSLNLKVIDQLKKRYQVSVGLSDHSTNPVLAPILAIGLGATIIEKHFTLNKKSKGPDHASSIEPSELKILTEGALAIFKARGKSKKIHQKEKQIIKWARESVVSLKEIKKGEKFTRYNTSVKRPAPNSKEIPAKFFNKVLGKKAKSKILINKKLKWSQIN